MATMSPELILASYSCARRDHMVRLMRARPLSVSSARLTSGGFRQLAHADRHDLGGRNPQRHLVLDEIDDEQFELRTGDLLLLDGHDLADPVGRIDDEFVGLEALSLGSLLVGRHSGQNSFTGAFAAAGHFGCGGPGAGGPARGMRGPPRCGRLFGSPAHAGGTFLRFLTRFSCHCSRVDFTPSVLDPWDAAAKNKAPERGSASVAAFFIFIGYFIYIAHFWPKSKPYGAANAQFRAVEPAILVNRLTPATSRQPFAHVLANRLPAAAGRLSRRFHPWARRTS